MTLDAETLTELDLLLGNTIARLQRMQSEIKRLRQAEMADTVYRPAGELGDAGLDRKSVV